MSVIIANYPDAVLVEETLRSICERVPVEVVVVDDASPVPGTAERLAQLCDEGLIDVLHVREENAGHQAAFNLGISLASAPYTFILGNDDLLEPGALTHLVELLDADPDASFAVGAYERFGAAEGRYTPPPWDPWRLLFTSPYPACYMARREVYERVGGVQSNCIFEDWDTYVAFAEQRLRGIVSKRLIYRYRVHDTSRLSARSQREYRTQVERLRAGHPRFFDSARELRRASAAPTWRKLVMPVYSYVRLRTPRALIALAHRVVFRQGRGATTASS